MRGDGGKKVSKKWFQRMTEAAVAFEVGVEEKIKRRNEGIDDRKDGDGNFEIKKYDNK